MHITQLEIDNFKSFTKKTKIPFYEGFSVISGPNGSGKSNIVDSILFVLALSGSRTLRAEKLTDLINLNSGKNTAEVTITLSDGTRIRRRIKRTASGYYSYNYLNDRLCKQADVTEYLSRFGIKPHGYNVVMQGDITRIIEMSDFERRKMIDEIAGVAEFDAKRDQALTELEVVRERIEREEMLLHELAIRLEELAVERKQALAYQEWQEKLNHFESCRAVATLHEQEKELAALVRVIEEQNLSLERVKSDKSHEENELSYLQADLADIDEQINQKSGSEYLKLIADLEEAKAQIRLSEQSIARFRKDKEGNLEAINRTFVDLKRSETRVGECSQSIRELGIDRTNLAMEAATARAQVENIESAIQLQSRDAEGARDELFSLMSLVDERKAKRSDILHQKDMLLERSRLRSSEKERLDERLRAISEDYDSRIAQRDECAREILAKKEEKESMDRELSKIESGLFAKRSTLERVKEEYRGYEQEVMRLEAQQQARGESGGRAMEAVRGMDGVYGTVAQLGRAPPEYATALNVAAGSRIHYVVVEDDHVATSAIHFLKENRLGRMTFLPLTRLKPPALSPVEGEGILGYAVDMLEFDSRYRDAFRVVFGATVVVDSLSRARKLMGRFRMVTPDGELLERTGAMTGGSFKKVQKGFGTAVEEDIIRLRQKMASLEDEISDLESAVKRGTDEIDARRKTRAETDQEIGRLAMREEEFSKQADTLEQERERIGEALALIAGEVKAGTTELAALEVTLDNTTDEINQIGKKIDSIKKRLDDTDIPALSEELEKKKREADDIERRLRNKESDIADLQRERQHFNARVEELKAENERIGARNSELDAEISGAQEQIESSKGEIARIEERQKEFSGELENLRAKHTEVAEAIRESEKHLLEFEAAMERIRIQITALEERKAALDAEIETLRSEVGDRDTDLTLQEIEDGIAEATHEMRKIGAVNMLAIDEFDRVDKRIQERTEKKEVLSRERTDLLERIESFEQMKYDAFMTAFRAIDANFREVFARLTSGNGHLILENEEDPFSGGLSFAVQPRDKPVHLLSALSGGEKSLTTLAFIFSIQQYIPAPFYAFDEVDMSLDGSNVERIAEMIRELSIRSQFIIVSLRKPMIEAADRIVGVTLLSDKSSFVTGIKVNG